MRCACTITGLLLDGERKSIQPLAARLVDSDAEVEGMRQRLQQAVVVADWDDGIVRSRLAKLIDKEMPDLEAIVFDDTGFPKKGGNSAGVTRQYSGTLGVNAIDYLTDVLMRVQTHPASKIDELLPRRWKPPDHAPPAT